MLDTNSRVVSYADLNLNTQAGARVLYNRFRSAAAQVCGDVNLKRLEAAPAAKTCVDRAIVSSVRAVNHAQLTKIATAQGYKIPTQLNVAASIERTE